MEKVQEIRVNVFCSDSYYTRLLEFLVLLVLIRIE